jgi:TonB family protein
VKFRTILLFAAILLLIYPTCALSQQEMENVQSPTLRRRSEPIDTELLERIRNSAEQGDVTVQFRLGMMYRLGDGVPQDYAEAEKWLRTAAEQGYPPAQYNLGMMYRLGDGVLQDKVEAEKWIGTAAEQGYPPTQKESQESAIPSGPTGIPNDLETLKWIREDAERGDAIAQVILGLVYLQGNVVPQDYLEAAKWFRRAAERGDFEGQFQLGSLYYHGNGVPQDYAEAEKWLRKAAEQDHHSAQLTLGTMYLQDRIFPEKNAEAAKWFRKAADQGIAAGQFNLGVMYLEGTGVAKNPKEAAKWIRNAGEQGFRTAQFQLGWMYIQGEGVSQDYEEAEKWLRRAAEQSDNSAQCMLGTLYCEGKGAKQDYIQAHMWLNLCATSSNGERQEIAARLLDEIVKKMTQEQIQEAERLAMEWADSHALKVATGVYLAGKGVTAPVALVKPMPSYTEQARAASITGGLVVQCIIRKTGNLDSCQIIRGLGYGMDESAIKTMESEWRFKPGTLLGKPVDVRAKIELTFKAY